MERLAVVVIRISKKEVIKNKLNSCKIYKMKWGLGWVIRIAKGKKEAI